jgi:hypothetical protein
MSLKTNKLGSHTGLKVKWLLRERFFKGILLWLIKNNLKRSIMLIFLPEKHLVLNHEKVHVYTFITVGCGRIVPMYHPKAININ